MATIMVGEKVVITRHPALVEYLQEVGIVPEGVRVITRATEDDVRYKHVIGAAIPVRMAAKANRVTEIPLALTREDRGRKLSLERLREIAQPPRTYIVVEIRDA